MSAHLQQHISSDNGKPNLLGNSLTGASVMSGESLERLMDIILQMRINLQQVTVTFQQQTDEIREQLAEVFAEESKVLDGCLRRIDGTLRDCLGQIDSY